MKLYEISADEGKTFTEQWLTPSEALEIAREYWVRQKGSEFYLIPDDDDDDLF